MKFLILLSLALIVSTAALAGVVDPVIRTDTSVDARSAKTIVADLIKPGMTDEQKVLTLFNYLRRVIYHSGPEEALRHDFGLMMNVFGYGSCYMQTHPLSQLFTEAGFESRGYMHMGHHMLEVKYGGAWHCLDPHMTFYCYNRATPPALACVEELQKDETLAGEAVKEKRACPGFLLCGDKPKFFAGDKQWVKEGPFPKMKNVDKDFGAINLPSGTKYVRTWKAGKFFKPHEFGKGQGPYHTCGMGADKKDPINFPFWEPYKEVSGVRHFGTGYIEYAPNLKGDGWKEGAVKVERIASGKDSPALSSAEAGAESAVIFRLNCPYIITAATLDLTGVIGNDGDCIAVFAAKDNTESTKWVEVASLAETGPIKHSAELPAIVGAIDNSFIKIVMEAKEPGKTGLDSLKLHADFQLNPYALPHLTAGKNKLTASAAKAQGPWNLRIAWSEGADWKTPKEYKAAITGDKHEAVIEAEGPKVPRMEAIEVSVEP